MKMKLLLSIFILSLLVIYSCNQTSTSNSLINLDFEKTENGMPKGWYRLYYQPNYTISIDSTNVKSGNYSVAIEYTGGFTNFQNNYQAIQIVLPKKYEGEKITLSGYMKNKYNSEKVKKIYLFQLITLTISPKTPKNLSLLTHSKTMLRRSLNNSLSSRKSSGCTGVYCKVKEKSYFIWKMYCMTEL